MHVLNQTQKKIIFILYTIISKTSIFWFQALWSKLIFIFFIYLGPVWCLNFNRVLFLFFYKQYLTRIYAGFILFSLILVLTKLIQNFFNQNINIISPQYLCYFLPYFLFSLLIIKFNLNFIAVYYIRFYDLSFFIINNLTAVPICTVRYILLLYFSLTPFIIYFKHFLYQCLAIGKNLFFCSLKSSNLNQPTFSPV
jgi:hypothetical protein